MLVVLENQNNKVRKEPKKSLRSPATVPPGDRNNYPFVEGP